MLNTLNIPDANFLQDPMEEYIDIGGLLTADCRLQTADRDRLS